MRKSILLAATVVAILATAGIVGLMGQAQALPAGTVATAIMGDTIASGTTDVTIEVPAGFYDLTVKANGNDIIVNSLPERSNAAYPDMPVEDGTGWTWRDVYIEGFKVDRTLASEVVWSLKKAGR